VRSGARRAIGCANSGYRDRRVGCASSHPGACIFDPPGPSEPARPEHSRASCHTVRGNGHASSTDTPGRRECARCRPEHTRATLRTARDDGHARTTDTPGPHERASGRREHAPVAVGVHAAEDHSRCGHSSSLRTHARPGSDAQGAGRFCLYSASAVHSHDARRRICACGLLLRSTRCLDHDHGGFGSLREGGGTGHELVVAVASPPYPGYPGEHPRTACRFERFDALDGHALALHRGSARTAACRHDPLRPAGSCDGPVDHSPAGDHPLHSAGSSKRSVGEHPPYFTCPSDRPVHPAGLFDTSLHNVKLDAEGGDSFHPYSGFQFTAERQRGRFC
jgi:hypothetical protein